MSSDETKDTEMDVARVMTRQVVTVTPDTSVLNARRLLRRYGIRHLPVLHGDRLVGMLSDRDVLITDQQLVDSLSALDSDLLHGRYRPVSTIMSTPARTVSPSTPIAQAARILATFRIGALPVVDGSRLVGIISAADLLGHVNWPTAPSPHEPIATRMNPMPPGDDRPGRPAAKPTALIVEPDPRRRRQAARSPRASATTSRPAPGRSARPPAGP